MNPFESLHAALRYHIINTLGWGDLRRLRWKRLPRSTVERMCFCSHLPLAEKLKRPFYHCSLVQQPKAGQVYRFFMSVHSKHS